MYFPLQVELIYAILALILHSIATSSGKSFLKQIQFNTTLHQQIILNSAVLEKINIDSLNKSGLNNTDVHFYPLPMSGIVCVLYLCARIPND